VVPTRPTNRLTNTRRLAAALHTSALPPATRNTPHHHRSLNSTRGLTRCINTFSGYSCECGNGFLRVTERGSGVESCTEVNECLVSALPMSREACSCERCACVNTIGSYK
jgi:hypothetical protein